MAKLSNIVGQHGPNANVAQMLPSLATVSADKVIGKFVAQMFLHAQTFFGNICRSVRCFSVWPQCWAIIQLSLPNGRSQHAQREVRTMHSPNRMAAAPLLDLDGVDMEAASPEGENHGEEDGDDRILRLPRLRIHALVLVPFFQLSSSSKASSNSKQAAAFFRSAMF